MVRAYAGSEAMAAVEAEIDAREQSDAARWLEREMADNEGWSLTVPYQYAAAIRDALRNRAPSTKAAVQPSSETR